MRRSIALALCLALAGPAVAGKGGSGSNSGGSSSRPSSGGGFSGGSSKPSGLSGSRPSSSGFSGGSSKPAAPAPAPVKGISASGFSGGSAKPAVKTIAPLPDRTPTQVSKKPAADDFNKLAVEDSKRAESRARYEKAQAPAPTYKTPKGETKPVKADDPEVSYLRGRLDGERWASRPQRQDSFYGGYSNRPMIFYSDPYHPLLTYWLLDKGTDVAAMWMIHHASTIDAARRDAMYAQNADLRARVAALERQGVKKDPTWQPPGIDPDLAYNDGFVTAGYNPTPTTVDEYEYAEEAGGGVPTWVVILILVLVAGGIAFVLFVPRWNI